MSEPAKLKRFPTFATDEEAEAFVENADLSEYDFSGFKPARFEFDASDGRIDMRLPEDLLHALMARATREGMSFQRFIREPLERAAAEKVKT